MTAEGSGSGIVSDSNERWLVPDSNERIQLVVKMVVCMAVVAVCIFMACKLRYNDGFIEGLQSGYITALKSVVDGRIRVEGDKLIVEDDLLVFTDPNTGKEVHEMDIDKLEFVADKRVL